MEAMPDKYFFYRRGPDVFIQKPTGNILGGFSVSRCPDPLELAAFIVKSANCHDELLEALTEKCQYHHLPLINGWAHSISVGTGDMKKTIRCPLSEKARIAIAKARGTT